MRPVVALLLFVGMAAGLQGNESTYIRIVYGSVDMVYETHKTIDQYVMLGNSTQEVLCFRIVKKTDDMAEVTIYSESLSGSCEGEYQCPTIHAAGETVVGSGPDGDISMTIVTAPPPTPGPSPFPSYPNMYLRIVSGSVDTVYETQGTTTQYAILNYSAHEALCFYFVKDTDDIADVLFYSESFSGSCTGVQKYWRTICAAWETVVGSGPDGDISMTIVSAPPPTPGPAPFPHYPNMYFRIVYGSVDMVYESQNTTYQNVILNNSTHEVLCFYFVNDTDAIAEVNIYSESLSGSCSGEYKWHTIYAAWETVVGSGPDGDISMMVVAAPTPAPTATPAPTPSPSPTPTPTQPGSNMYVRIVYGSVDMVYESQRTAQQNLILNYDTHEVLCFNFDKETDDTAEVIIFSESFSGSCTGTWPGWVQIHEWTTVVGSGPDGNLSMMIVSAPPPTPGPAPFPSYPNMYFRIVYGSVDTVYVTYNTEHQYLILNNSTHEVLCFNFEKDTDAIAEVTIFSESLSGSCSGDYKWHTIYAAWETVVGSGPDGDLSMTIVAAPPPTPGPAPFPSYPNMYFRIVYGSVDIVYETQNSTYQNVIINNSTHEVLCFNFQKDTDDIAEVNIYSESLSGSCSGEYKWHTIYAAWETVVGSGPDGDISMMVVAAPTPAPTATPAPTPAPTPSPSPTPTPTQPGSNMYVRIVYGSVDMVYESQRTAQQNLILNYTTHEVLCFNFDKETDDTAQVIIFSESFSGSCTGTWPGWVQIHEWTTVVGSGPDGNISMTIVSAPPPTPGPAPFPSYPNMYFRIVYGSVDIVYETYDTEHQYLILNNSTHEVLCFNFEKDTDAIAEVTIFSESLSGSCSGDYKWHTIYAAWETVVGSGPDGDISMTIVAAPPPTPGPAPFPSYPNMYFRIVYGSVDTVYETQNSTYQNVILNNSTHEVLCFNFQKDTDDIAEVNIYSESLSGSCSGEYKWHTIYDAWETVVGSGPDGDISMMVVAAPTPAPTATPAPTPSPSPTPTPTQPGSNMYVRIVYGSVDTVHETYNTEHQYLILNYTTHEVLCFNFERETDDIAEVNIFSQSLSGSCSGDYKWDTIYAAWETVVGSGPDGDISMAIVSAPTPAPTATPTAHPPTATPTAAPTATPTAHPLTAVPTPSPGSDDKLEIILIVLSATIVVILLVFAIMMYKSRHPPVPPITPVVDEDPIQTGLLPVCERIE